MRLLRVSFIALCVALTVSGVARAQALQVFLPPEVTPPRLTHDSPAEAPAKTAAGERWTEAVTVVLVVDVDAQGAVSGVAIKEGHAGGFDEAAMEAAKHLRFDPAKRDGVPVASRILFRYVFTPPPSPPAAPLPPSPPSAAPRTDTAPVEDVDVRGARPAREVTRRTLSAQEMDRSPGTNGDALQSLQNLPGVARPPPISGQLFVRGSAPEDTKVYVDGTDIPIAYHFGGLASVVPTELLERVDFTPGNFSAQWGRGMGGVVDVGLRDPKSDRLHGFAQVDALDVRLLAEGPVFGTGWTFLAAGRRSNPLLDALVSDTASGTTIAPRYYDGQALLAHKIGDHGSLRLAFFGSDDALQILDPTPGSSSPLLGGTLSNHTGFWRVQARFEDRIAEGTKVRATAAVGQDSLDVDLGATTVHTVMQPISLRAELSQKIAPWVTLNTGVDLVDEPYRLDLSVPPATSPGHPSGGPGILPAQSRASGSMFLPGAYAELELTPWRGMRLVPGLRADYDTATKSGDLAPRVTARQDLASGFPQTTLKAGAGLFDQPPQAAAIAPGVGQPGIVSSRAAHYDVGLDQQVTKQIDLSVDCFYKRFSDLVVAGSGNSGDGEAYGVEWLLRYKADERFFGWLSYTIARSTRRDGPGQQPYLFAFDQTHILTLLGSIKLGRGWQLGARFRLVSGDPYTPTSEGAFDATSGAQLGTAAYPPNGARLPLFKQLDLRMDKTWTFKAWRLSLYVDVQNVTDAKNVESVTYNYDYTRSGQVTGLPIVPTLGVRGEF